MSRDPKTGELREHATAVAALWIGVAPSHCGGVVVSFIGDEGVIRLLLDQKNARSVYAAIGDYLTTDQSPKSSGMPSSDVSPQEGSNV
jgi:hypothetical protein